MNKDADYIGALENLEGADSYSWLREQHRAILNENGGVAADRLMKNIKTRFYKLVQQKRLDEFIEAHSKRVDRIYSKWDQERNMLLDDLTQDVIDSSKSPKEIVNRIRIYNSKIDAVDEKYKKLLTMERERIHDILTQENLLD